MGGRGEQKEIFDQLRAQNFDPIGMRKTLKDVLACPPFVSETDNEILQKNRIRKLPAYIKMMSATTVSDVYKRNMEEVITNEIEMCASVTSP